LIRHSNFVIRHCPYNARMSQPASPVRAAALKIVQVLHDAGHVAYFAGGCVRDTLLGLSPKDYDIATDAHPRRVGELFRHTQFVGEAFGVVLVRLMGHVVEVATFRAEAGYDDGRRPTHVTFTDAQHDAQRRDFTINGLFEDPLAPGAAIEQRVIDHVGGVADLKAGVLRAIGDPDERFGEDYLRMLRAARFAARFNFQIETRTARAVKVNARYLGQISRERIGQEVKLMLTGSRPALACRLMQDLTLDAPTLGEPHLDAKLSTVQSVPAGAPYAVTLAAWLLDRHVLHEPEAQADLGHALSRLVHQQLESLIKRWRGALCLSNEDRDLLRLMLTDLPDVTAWPQSDVARRKRLLARAQWPGTWTLLQAMAWLPAARALVEAIDRDSPALLAQGVAPTPFVTGDDLIAQGEKPGPAFRQVLDAVYDAQLRGEVGDRSEALAWVRARRGEQR
jgi:tRNA nucleotidyltransferase/poly(A) polymerase